jgi:hypothetical protein
LLWLSVGFLTGGFSRARRRWRRLDGEERMLGLELSWWLKREAGWPVDEEKEVAWSSRECTWPDMVMPLTCKGRERKYIWLFLV